jgi:hypothetical protein
MNYTKVSEGLPLLPGMYIVVYKLAGAGGKPHKVHALRYYENGKWSLEGKLDTSTMVAYAGPIEQYKEETDV